MVTRAKKDELGVGKGRPNDRTLIRTAESVRGDMHWLKDMTGGATPGNKGSSRSTWCGLTDIVYSMGRGSWKATYNRRHVTCQGCLATGPEQEGGT